MYRRAAGYIAKILRGTKASDLPIEQPINFEFAVNLKTAKTLDLVIPATLLTRADEVIERSGDFRLWRQTDMLGAAAKARYRG